MHVIMNTVNGPNFIQKDIVNHPYLRCYFSAKVKIKSSSKPHKAYYPFCKLIPITELFSVFLYLQISLIFDNIEIPLILGVHLLQS